jgi:hypothetical protein
VPMNGNPGAPVPVNNTGKGPATPKKKKTMSTTPHQGPKPQLAPKAPITHAAWRTAAPAATSTAPVHASPSPSPASGRTERGPSAGAQVYNILEGLAAPVKPAGHSPGGRRLLNGL